MPKDPRSVQQVQGTRAARAANYTGGRPKDETKLSVKPSQARNRLRRAMQKAEQKGGLKHIDGRVQRDVEMLYKKPIDEWDIEELAHGRPRSRDGKFTGQAPKWITPLIVAEAKRRLLNQTFGSMAAHIPQAIKVIGELMTSDEVDDKGRPIVDARTKFAAAQFTLEHYLGKPTIFVQAEVADFTRSAIASAIVLDDGESEDHFILEGEYTEEEDEDDDA